MSVRVRPATAADAAAIARVHVDSWRGAYDGLLPPGYLSALDDGTLAQRWQHKIATGVPVWAAERAGSVCGFAVADRCTTDPELDELAGEVTMLYVHPYAAGAGVGSALLGEVESSLAARPLYWLLVWVVERNFDARAFYAARGLRPDGARRSDQFLGRPISVVRYCKPLNPAIDYDLLLASEAPPRVSRPSRRPAR